MLGHCVKCGRLIDNDAVTIEMPTMFRRQWSYHRECAPKNDPQHHIPPALLEALRKYIELSPSKMCDENWADVLLANLKDSNEH